MCRSALLVLLGLSLELVNSFPSQEPEGAKHWVVIVAGSNGWYNYRHQVRSVTKMLIQPVKMHHWPKFMAFSLRLTHVMRTRLSTKMGSQMSRLWLWCMMTWPKMKCKFASIHHIFIIHLCFQKNNLPLVFFTLAKAANTSAWRLKGFTIWAHRCLCAWNVH